MALKIASVQSNSSLSRKLLIIPLLGFFVLLFIIPLAKLFVISIHFKEGYGFYAYYEILSKSVFRQVYLNTMLISFWVASITMIICFPISYMLSKKSTRRATRYFAIIMLPLWMSLLVRSFAWVVILQKEGILNKLLRTVGLPGHDLLYNKFSVIAAMVYVFVPYVVFILYSNFRKINSQLISSGYSLGTNKSENFFMVFLPQVKNNILFAYLYVFIVSFGYFITPALLGGARETTISMLVDNDMNQTLNWTRGAALSFVILGTVLSLVVLMASTTFKNIRQK